MVVTPLGCLKRTGAMFGEGGRNGELGSHEREENGRSRRPRVIAISRSAMGDVDRRFALSGMMITRLPTWIIVTGNCTYTERVGKTYTQGQGDKDLRQLKQVGSGFSNRLALAEISDISWLAADEEAD